MRRPQEVLVFLAEHDPGSLRAVKARVRAGERGEGGGGEQLWRKNRRAPFNVRLLCCVEKLVKQSFALVCAWTLGAHAQAQTAASGREPLPLNQSDSSFRQKPRHDQCVFTLDV
eukprot:594327-Pleurochrysis_carterae.AAC.2